MKVKELLKLCKRDTSITIFNTDNTASIGYKSEQKEFYERDIKSIDTHINGESQIVIYLAK